MKRQEQWPSKNMHRYLLAQEIELLAVGHDTVRSAVRQVLSCERCNPLASTPFGLILEKLTGNAEKLTPQSSVLTECVLCEPARCPNCHSPIIEATLVQSTNEGATYDVLELIDRPTDETNVVLVDQATLEEVQASIAGCEHCCEEAELSLDYILDEVTGLDPTVTEYVLCHPAKCPACRHEVTEKTLIVAR